MYFKTLGRRELAYSLFLVMVFLCYVLGDDLALTEERVNGITPVKEDYGSRPESKLGQVLADVDAIRKKQDQSIVAIEEQIGTYLHQIPDYSYIHSLRPYLKYLPKLLEQFPSAVPLERGDYTLSSDYGIRIHPISGKRKKHFGIDFPATWGRPVYASATGLVTDIVKSEKGYGTYIIIQHRFGFKTLYGHLDKVLVWEGQQVLQHGLIATVGNSGSSTGYHLHYEIIKNGTKIDPRVSFGLKKEIYSSLIDIEP